MVRMIVKHVSHENRGFSIDGIFWMGWADKARYTGTSKKITHVCKILQNFKVPTFLSKS